MECLNFQDIVFCSFRRWRSVSHHTDDVSAVLCLSEHFRSVLRSCRAVCAASTLNVDIALSSVCAKLGCDVQKLVRWGPCQPDLPRFQKTKKTLVSLRSLNKSWCDESDHQSHDGQMERLFRYHPLNSRSSFDVTSKIVLPIARNSLPLIARSIVSWCCGLLCFCASKRCRIRNVVPCGQPMNFRVQGSRAKRNVVLRI